jgi:hypothetical protein
MNRLLYWGLIIVLLGAAAGMAYPAALMNSIDGDASVRVFVKKTPQDGDLDRLKFSYTVGASATIGASALFAIIALVLFFTPNRR